VSGELESVGAQEATSLSPSPRAGSAPHLRLGTGSIASGGQSYTYRTRVGFQVGSGVSASTPPLPAPRQPQHEDDLAWVGLLPQADLTQFLDELKSAVATLEEHGSAAELVQIITEWRSTAEAYNDADVVAAVTGESHGDLGAVSRP